MTHFALRGHELSPIKHLYLKVNALKRAEKVELLQRFVDEVNILRRGKYTTNSSILQEIIFSI